MIVKLKNKSTKPYIKLNPDSPHEGQELTVIGFGDTDKGSGSVVIPTVLNQVDVTYITNEQCQSMHLDRYEISDDMICAMGDNKDTCNGDSGGPLILKGESSEEDELVGAVTWSFGCADSRYPGVYSRITYFYDWIVDTACELSDSPPEYFNCPETYGATVLALAAVDVSHPAFPSSAPTANIKLEFRGWDPEPLPLEHCAGDCDRDKECAGDMVCFQRNSGMHVPVGYRRVCPWNCRFLQISIG